MEPLYLVCPACGRRLERISVLDDPDEQHDVWGCKNCERVTSGTTPLLYKTTLLLVDPLKSEEKRDSFIDKMFRLNIIVTQIINAYRIAEKELCCFDEEN